ncbi:MAG: hypothetical protein ACLQDV_09445 [Candidatus Binataceae bacterium]
MDSQLTLVVALHIHPGHEAEYEQFESAAARIMSRYGGRIERRIRRTAPAADTPYEVHLVTFPDPQAFERYREDAELKGLAEMRARAIRATIVWSGVDLPTFEI